VSENLTCSQIIKDNGIGIVSNDTVMAIKNIYANYKIHKNIALKGQEYVIDNLTWDKYCESMMRFMANGRN
jgi:hypothetical protein